MSSSFTEPNPTQTASRASSYVPSFGTSIGSARQIVTTIVPAAAASNPNPSTPSFQDDHQWITAYLTIHQLSTPSYRYMYILWLAVVLIFVVFAVLHWTGRRGGALGGLWSKWSLRRRTWRKKHSLAKAQRQNKPHKQPSSLPSNAQLLSLSVLYAATLLLCFLGPDYIAPGTHVWDLVHNVTVRDLSASMHMRADRAPAAATNSQPGYTIPKAWWTSGGRTGTMAFALFPLCVLFALKSPPFALFALPFLIQIYNDKLALLHRWTGRLIWFVTALHVALWSVQLSHDKRSNVNPSSVWNFAFEYDKFVFGWLGFICLTLLVALSFRPVRIEFYETFYILHVLLIPLTLIFSAFHFPPIGWWCWATLAIWGAERLWRLVRFLRINGIIGGPRGGRNMSYLALVNERASGWQKPFASEMHLGATDHFRGKSNASQGSEIISSRGPDGISVAEGPMSAMGVRPRPFSIGQETMKSFQTSSSVELIAHAAPHSAGDTQFPPYGTPSQSRVINRSLRDSYSPPPGYAHATLLPGRTIRLRFIPPHHFTWAPGQHVLLTVPSISKFSSHPFTIASICDSEAMSDAGREVVILIRARTGFTKDLWSHIEQLEESRQVGDVPNFPYVPPNRGVLLRACLDGPFGSSIRARWTSYSTVLIIAGGSGVSFAVAVLEYACMCMVGRNGRLLGGKTGSWGHGSVSQISRIRFVWIVREFSHIQWAASVIRKCMNMLPASALQVDIFVTNVAPKRAPSPSLEVPGGDNNALAPPTPYFARSRNRRNSNASDISLESTISTNTFADVSYLQASQTESGIRNDVVDIVDMYGELGHEEHVLDLTNFDGEDDTRLPGETHLSRRLRKEGKLRRARTRKSQGALLAKLNLEPRTAEMSAQPRQHLSSPHDPRGFRSSTFARDMSQTPAISESHSSASHNPFSPSGTGENFLSPLSPRGHVPSSSLHVDSEGVPRGVSPAPSTKSDTFTIYESETQNRYRNAELPRAQFKFDMDEAEAEDLPIVAERARPGKAKIDRLLADEAGRSRGAMVVACCGPTSLNAVVRKCVAAQIDPARILRGDSRASIALVSEDFEW